MRQEPSTLKFFKQFIFIVFFNFYNEQGVQSKKIALRSHPESAVTT